jgi:Protein of unknown function (DUF2716)
VTIWKEVWSRPAREFEENALWDSFCERFNFRPNIHDPNEPGIIEPSPSVVFDISALPHEGEAKVRELFLTAFRAVVPADDELAFLDWQHPTFRFNPHDRRIGPDLPVLPDGDYYIIVAADLSFGTFGHPWQQSLCVFGAPLLSNLPDELFRLLPILRQYTVK